MTAYFPHRTFPLPDDEAGRLRIAHKFAFLADRSSELGLHEGLDRVCELARSLLGVDRAFVSLVLESEQRFLARANLDASRTPRAIAFCAYAIASTGTLVIPDARLDERFAGNPLVEAPMHVRFYAGAPLHSDGAAIGTFCVTDEQPRELDPAQLAQLEHLAAIALAHLELLVTVRELREQSLLLRQSEKLAHVGGWAIDLDEDHTVWSHELYRLHEVSVDEPVTRDLVASLYPDGELQRLEHAIQNAAATMQGFEIEVEFVTTTGKKRHARLLAEIEAREGRLPRLIGTFRDLTEQRVAEAERERALIVDAVTSLPNHVRLMNRLADLHSDCEAGTLLLVGLDGFKAINETFGRDKGDELLRQIGAQLLARFPDDALVARLGGNEFAVVIPGVRNGLAIRAACQIASSAVQAVLDAHPERIACSASLGVTVFPDDALLPTEILACAEIALRNAESLGGGRTEYFAPALRTRIEVKTQLLADVARGLAAGEFELHYQPICGITGLARGFEGLMRWNHATRGLLTPYHFMLAFADAELSLQLGEVALRQATTQMQTWQAAGLEFGYIAVNLSGTQLAQPDLATQITELLRAADVPPHRLMLELTESIYLDGDRAQNRRTLDALREVGVSFALDDFGTGYASLTHLREFAVDRIKVDQSFVQQIGKDAGSSAIIRAIVSLGAALQLHVVAEGVETAEQLAFLQGVGCEYIQGYYFARPMPAALAVHHCRQLRG